MDLSRHAISSPGTDPGAAGMPCAVPSAVQVAAGRPGAEVGAGPVGVVRDFVAWLAGVDGAAIGGDQCAGDGFDDAARLDLIGALEAVKAAAAAAQARVTTAFAASQREVHLARGGKPQQAARSIGSQVALARRDSPSRGDQHVGFAHALHVEMPHTMAALTRGVISEYRATLIVRETACLTREQRGVVDERLAPDLPSLGNRSLAAAARRIAAHIDAAAVVARMERAVASRRVTVRPAPDGMAWLTFLAPLTEAVGAYAALDRLAKTALTTVVTGNDPQQSNPPANGNDSGLGSGGGAAVPGRGGQTRTRGQLMVDLGLDRIFGRTTSTNMRPDTSTCHGTTTRPNTSTLSGTSTCPGTSHRTETTGATATGTIAGSRAPSDTPTHAAPPTTTPTAAPAGARTSTDTGSDGSPRVNVEIQLVMTPDTLFARSSEPAHLPGYGPIPAAIARTLVRDADQAWIRRLFTTPNTRDLVALDSTRRFFNGGLRRLLVLRDQTCRTPWCDAPITAADHTHPAHRGGTTTAANGTGLCQRCNNTKETPGWHTDVISTGLPRNDLHDTMDTGDVPVQTQNDHKSTATLAQTDHQPHTTQITTPTGKTYHSIAPPILGWGASTPQSLMRPVAPTTADEESVSEPLSALERRLTLMLVA